MSNSDHCLITFTHWNKDEIVAYGGDYHWPVKSDKVKETCKYLICTSSNDENKYTAFLIGKISDVVEYENTGRYSIMISEYALINVPNLWTKMRRSFVYKTLEELEIDADELEFEPIPDRIELLYPEEAKLRLAKTFKVPVEAIKISIAI